MKKEFTAILTVAAMLLCGCGSGSSSSTSSSNNSSNSNNHANPPQTQATTTEETISYNYNCAADLVGEALADIKAAGFDYTLIQSLNDYDISSAKPYTILVDETQAFAAAVICKGSAVIANGVDTNVTMDELGITDYDSELGWSAAFQSTFNRRILTYGGGKYNVRYMWTLPDPNDFFSVYTDVKSDCAMVYKDGYIYTPDDDFMWFKWENSIYDVTSDLTSRGFSIEDSPLVKNSYTTRSVSEKLYGKSFYIYLYYNANGQFTGGTYNILCSLSENADVYEAAQKDLISKYGDSDKLEIRPECGSVAKMLRRQRTDDYVDPYHFSAETTWNVNNRTSITLRMYSNSVEIIYKSISSTGGTGSKEDSLI